VCALVLYAALPSSAHAEPQTLEQAWTQAYRNNPSLEAQRAALRATDEQVSQALSNWRPSVDATGTYGKTWQFAPDLAPFENPTFDDKTRSVGAQVTQPLFRGFRTKEATEAAEKQVLAGRAKLASAEQQLFLDTASAYLGVVRDEIVLELERHHETVLEDKLKETRARSDAGELTGTDVRQAESRLARAHVARFQAESALTQDRAAFTRLVGAAPGQLQAPALVLESPRTLADIFQSAETRNPDVVSAQFAVEQADAEIKLSKGTLLPEVDLVGNTGRSWGQNITVPGREDSSQVLVQVTMPLYRSGTDYSKARAAEQTYSQRRDELDEARHKAHETADNAWQALMTAQAALDADKSEVDAADEALKGVTEESKVGTRTTLDVLNAEQELLDARIDQVRSQHDRDFAVLQIRAAVGQLTADNLKLPVEPYDPKRHYEDVRNQWAGFSRDDARYRVAPEPSVHSQ
jgi:TolC family type I secretion outer membrane protein